MGNIESVDGESEMKHHIMPLKVPMPDPTELEERFAIVLVSMRSKYTVNMLFYFINILKTFTHAFKIFTEYQVSPLMYVAVVCVYTKS